MNKSRSIFYLSIFLCAGLLPAQIITAPSERDTLLGDMNEVIENTEREGESFSDVESPFHSPKKLKAAPVAVDSSGIETAEREGPEEDMTPQILNDRTALQLISRQFKPLGSMVLGDRGYLQLPGGRTLQKGQSFNAEIKGVTYTVELLDVTEKDYTLQLGSANISQTFLKTGVNP